MVFFKIQVENIFKQKKCELKLDFFLNDNAMATKIEVCKICDLSIQIGASKRRLSGESSTGAHKKHAGEKSKYTN